MHFIQSRLGLVIYFYSNLFVLSVPSNLQPSIYYNLTLISDCTNLSSNSLWPVEVQTAYCDRKCDLNYITPKKNKPLYFHDSAQSQGRPASTLNPPISRVFDHPQYYKPGKNFKNFRDNNKTRFPAQSVRSDYFNSAD